MTLPEVIPDFESDCCPYPIVDDIRDIVAFAPEPYLAGLKLVRLASSRELSRTRRRSHTRSRGRKVMISEALGLYHRAHQRSPAYIELFVDRILPSGVPFFRVTAVRRFVLAQTFFHELGHHLHATIKREHRETEDVADEWAKKLATAYIKQRYPIVSFQLRLLGKAIRPFRASVLKYVRKRAAKNGA